MGGVVRGAATVHGPACAAACCHAVKSTIRGAIMCHRTIPTPNLFLPTYHSSHHQARMEILKIHASSITKHGDIDYEAVIKLGDGFNGADLRNVCTEAGMFAIRDERDYVVQVGADGCWSVALGA